MRWILGVVGALLGGLLGEEGGLFAGLALGMLIGWIIEREKKRTSFVQTKAPLAPFEQRATSRIVELTARVERLEQELAALRVYVGAESATETRVVATPAGASLPLDTVAPAVELSSPDEGMAAATASTTTPSEAVDPTLGPRTAMAEQPVPSEPGHAWAPSHAAAPSEPGAIERASAAVRQLLFGGNTVVRIGVLVLTVGLGLLAKYATEHAYLPLEVRLALAAATGVAMVLLGYRLHQTRPGFATAIQGGGVAALYLVTFFSYYSYRLLPAALTLALLVVIAALSALLAVVQDAQQLAVFGAIGGFLAPILASTGGGSHVALFSYYALLNVVMVAIALFRAWRVLNWTGFLFTFGVASAWGVLRYAPEHMASSSAFLALFTLLFLADGTLFSLRLAGARRGTIDTTLTFGTPLAALALAGGLFADHPLYLALAAALLSALYLGSASTILARRDPALTPLMQAYLAIGVAAVTIAIPFALDSALATSLAWASEAAGLVWAGCRQARLRTRIAGYALFVAGLLSLLARIELPSLAVRALYCALFALALAFAAVCLRRAGEKIPPLERYVEKPLLALFTLLWIAAIHMAAGDARVPGWLSELALLGLIAASALALEWVGVRASAPPLRTLARFVFPYTLLILPGALLDGAHPFAGWAPLGWLALGGSGYLVLRRQRALLDELPKRRDALHATGVFLFALLFAIEAHELTKRVLLLAEGFVDGATLLAPLALLLPLVQGRPDWPVAAYPRAYVRWSALPIALLLTGMAMARQAESSAAMAPLPYLPLLNMLDVAHALTIAALMVLLRRTDLTSGARKLTRWMAAGSGFVLLNGAVVHTAHHWLGAPFIPWQIPPEPIVQASFSILWTLLALAAMVSANRRALRPLWVAGAALLSCVVLKLFVLDFANLSSVTKIVTFLAVGVLLLAVGYFAPVPPSATSYTPKPEST
jgi:uncharacterized membrane protein